MPDEPVAVTELTTPVIETPVAPASEETTELAPQVPAVETPVVTEVAPSSVPPATLPSATLPPDVQEYVTRLEQQAQGAREQNDLHILNQVVAQHAQALEQRYALTPEQALELAQAQGNIVYRQYQSEQMQRGRFRAAISIAQQFGVDPLQLLNSTSPQAMQETARTLSATTRQATENAQLKARIAALEKGRVPAQTFSQGAQPGAGAGLTGDALESAWLKHEVEQSDKPNPYDSAYRLMLRG